MNRPEAEGVIELPFLAQPDTHAMIAAKLGQRGVFTEGSVSRDSE